MQVEDEKWVGEIGEAVRNLKELIVALTAALHEHMHACPLIEVAKDHETRLRKVEAWRWQMIGALLIINAAGAATVIAILRKILESYMVTLLKRPL